MLLNYLPVSTNEIASFGYSQDEEGGEEEEEESDYQPSDASAVNEGSDGYDSEEDYTSEDEEEDESGTCYAVSYPNCSRTFFYYCLAFREILEAIRK